MTKPCFSRKKPVKSVFLMLFIFSIICISFEAFSAPLAYLGVVEFTPSNGNFGHAFIAINHTEHVGDSQIYSFSTASNDPEKALNGTDILLQKDHVVFSYEVLNLSQYVNIYQSSLDRTTRVHRLNLTGAEALQLEQQLLSVDINQLNQDEKYNILTNNCITKALEKINSIVDQDRQLQISAPDSFLELNGSGIVPLNLVDTLYNNFPFHVNRILSTGHPLSFGESIDFFSSTLQKIRLLGAVFRHIKDLTASCSLSTQVEESLKAHFTILSKNHETAVNLEELYSITNTCDQNKSLQSAESVINYIRVLSEMERQ